MKIAGVCAGSIDYEEFIAATINLNRLEQEAAYQKAFQVFDTDNSGFLSLDEIKEALSVSLASPPVSPPWLAPMTLRNPCSRGGPSASVSRGPSGQVCVSNKCGPTLW